MNHRSSSTRRGAILPLMVIIFPVVLILCGFAINWAQLQLVRTEMQIATDASCRAACRTYMITNNLTQARIKAQQLADKNLVGHKRLILQDSDLERGVSVRSSVASRYNFTPKTKGVNALRLTVAKDPSSLSGPVNLYFPMFGGLSTASLQTRATSAQVELDIALVIDRSGSMAYSINEVSNPLVKPAAAPSGWSYGQHVPPNSRWADTVDAVKIFLDELALYPQQKWVSLTTYGTDSLLETDLDPDHAPIMSALKVYTQAFPSGATNITSGLITASDNLAASPNARSYANKVIVLMTDGIHNWGPDPTSVAADIAAEGVTIFTVTFSDEANQTMMKDVAEIGGGRHFHATTSALLKKNFRQIAREMPTILVQ